MTLASQIKCDSRNTVLLQRGHYEVRRCADSDPDSQQSVISGWVIVVTTHGLPPAVSWSFWQHCTRRDDTAAFAKLPTVAPRRGVALPQVFVHLGSTATSAAASAADPATRSAAVRQLVISLPRSSLSTETRTISNPATKSNGRRRKVLNVF
jgi:hypothetical protein